MSGRVGGNLRMRVSWAGQRGWRSLAVGCTRVGVHRRAEAFRGDSTYRYYLLALSTSEGTWEWGWRVLWRVTVAWRWNSRGGTLRSPRRLSTPNQAWPAARAGFAYVRLRVFARGRGGGWGRDGEPCGARSSTLIASSTFAISSPVSRSC